MFDSSRRRVLWDRLTELRHRLVAGMQGGLGALSAMDLTVPQSMALFRLVEQGPQSISQLQRVTGRSQAATSHLVTQLERRQLVERRADSSDGRKTLVCATKKASALVRQVEGLRIKGFEAVVAKVPERVLERFDQGLEALLEELGELS